MYQEDIDLARALQFVTELGEQLSHNQKIVAALQNQTSQLKNQAIHNGTGYALRRFNIDLSKETFESELERMNAQIIIENQTLLKENKQLSILLKEYEQTLETVMSKFRNHAVAAQRHELTLTRHYEILLLSRETNRMNIDLSNNSNVNASLQRLSQHLRMLLRSIGGEEVEDTSVNDGQSTDDGRRRELEGREDWALEREYEIARLEKENEELRRMLGIDSETSRAHGITDEDLADRRPCLTHEPARHSQSLTLESWERLSPPQTQTTFGAAPMAGSGGNAAGMSEMLQNQRSADLQAGMRAGTLRRPSLFGRGRGSGPPSLWGPPQAQERGWGNLHGNGGSGVDLMG